MFSPTRRRFLQQLTYGAGAWLALPTWIQGREPGGTALARSTPEAEGVSSAGILAFLEAMAASRQELHSFMMLRHGRVLAEGWWAPYAPELRHWLYSLSKSFTSTAIGLCVAEGRLKVDERVTSFFPESLPETVSGNLASMRVRDLLTMAAGHATEPMPEMVKQEDWVKAFLAWPVPREPGLDFLYNSAATYFCSAIVQKLTKQTLLEYLQPRLLEPLGIEGATWETCPRGINTGGWGLAVRTEDLAKFGQLYLQKGAWQGRQLIPARWVEEATSFKIQQPLKVRAERPVERDDWQQGYCYQFWRCTHEAYRGDGAFGQFCVVLPKLEAVIIMTGESTNLQGELNLVWEHLLPAMQDAPLPPAEVGLRQRLAGLSLPPPAWESTSKMVEQIGGKSFTLEENALGLRKVAFTFEKTKCRVVFHDDAAEYAVDCGLEKWIAGETGLPGTPPRYAKGGASPRGTKYRVAASATWKDASTLLLTWRFIETPHRDTVTCTFEGDTVKIAFLNSFAERSGKTSDGRPVLTGKRVG